MWDDEADADCRRGIPGQGWEPIQQKGRTLPENTGIYKKGEHSEKKRLTFIIVELSFRGFSEFSPKFGLCPELQLIPTPEPFHRR